MKEVRVGVLVSGRGSNLQALLDGAIGPARVTRVVSNVPDVYALQRAEQAGVATSVVTHRGRTREDFEDELIATLGDVEWVCLAGFMRVLTAHFVARFPNRILNVHPALLPSFPGAHGIADALAYGVGVAGCTVHLVDAGVDSGPILAQGVVGVRAEDTEPALAARVLPLEHQLYPRALRWCAEGRVRVEGRRALVDLPPGEERFLFA